MPSTVSPPSCFFALARMGKCFAHKGVVIMSFYERGAVPKTLRLGYLLSSLIGHFKSYFQYIFQTLLPSNFVALKDFSSSRHDQSWYPSISSLRMIAPFGKQLALSQICRIWDACLHMVLIWRFPNNPFVYRSCHMGSGGQL